MLSLLAMALVCSRLLVVAGLLAALTRANPDGPVVTVKNGSYVGLYSPQYKQDFFLGMPYAQKPVRFMNSQHLDSSWEGTREATKYPPHCVGYGDDNIGYEMSEDCLYLNVIRPAGIDANAQLPVALYVHGGALRKGGFADKRFNMSFIVERSVQMGTPIIGVSLNYRLHVFGFPWGKEVLQAGVGNLGFKDQRLGLRWVNENIGAFGGSKDKVTMYGESAGAESVSAQTFAYNGRDDGLFRAVIGQSGFNGGQWRVPGGYNATETQQKMYDSLVTNTSCASTVHTLASLDCLRQLPLAELNTLLNGTSATANLSWGPVLDGDFVSDYPSVLLREGKFPKIPLMIGCTTDEGTKMPRIGQQIINTDAEMRASMALILPNNCQATTGETADQLTDELMKLYPNDQAVGIPGLDKFPAITDGSALAKQLGLQYRRAIALVGDYKMQFTRRRTSIAWSNHDVPSWSYRFDVVITGTPGYIGSTHFDEVAFVFYNLEGVGYGHNPFTNASPDYIGVAKIMSQAWINFVVGLDPNGGGATAGTRLALPGGQAWVAYDAKSGAVGQNLVFAVNGSYLEKDDWRREGLAWMADHSVSIFGN